MVSLKEKLLPFEKDLYSLAFLFLFSLVPFARLFDLNASYGYGDGIVLLPANLTEYKYLSLWGSENMFGTPAGSSSIQSPLKYLMFQLNQWGLSSQFSHRLITINAPLCVGLLSMYLLLQNCFHKRLVSVIGSIVFIANSYVFDRISAGHEWLLPAYFISPLILFILRQCIVSQRWVWVILCALVVACSAMFDLRSVYIMLILCGLWTTGMFFWQALCHRDIRKLIKATFRLLIASIIIVALLAYFWFPLVFDIQTANSTLIPSAYHTALDWVFALSKSKAYSALSFKHIIWNWDTAEAPWLHSLPLLAGAGLIKYRRSPYIFGFLITYLVGVFLSKGIQPPLGDIYVFFFKYVPGFNAFRDPLKFYALIGLGISPLVGLGINATIDWFVKQIQWRLSSVIYRPFLLIIFALSFIFIMSDAYLQKIGGAFVNYQFPTWHNLIKQELESKDQFYRVMWSPYFGPLTHRSFTHPSLSTFHLITNDFSPFAKYKLTRNIGYYETSTVYYLDYLLRPATLKLLQVFGVGKFYAPNLDYNKEVFAGKYNYDIESQEKIKNIVEHFFINENATLRLSESMQQFPNDQKTTIYDLPEHKDHFFTSPKAIYVVGDNTIFDSLYAISPEMLNAPVIRLNDTDINFRNQSLFYELTSPDDLWFEFAAKQAVIVYPVNQLLKNAQPPQEWDVSQFENGSYQSFLSYKQGEIVAKSKASVDLVFDIKNSATHIDQYGLWVRVANEKTANGVAFEVNLPSCKEKPCVFQLSETSDKLGWYRLGDVALNSGTHKFNLQSFIAGGKFAAFALLPLAVEIQAKQHMLEVMQSNSIALSVPFKSKNTAELNTFKAGTYSLKVGLKLETPTPDTNSPKEICITLHERFSAVHLPIQCLLTSQYLYSTVYLSFGDINLNSPQQEWKMNISDENTVVESHLVLAEKSFDVFGSSEKLAVLPNLTYYRLSPTEYRVRLEEIQQPFYLVFSEAFYPGWVVTLPSGQSIQPVRAYGLIQSYFIDLKDDAAKDTAELIIEYIPQRYVPYGFILSGLTLGLLLLGLSGLYMRDRLRSTH